MFLLFGLRWQRKQLQISPSAAMGPPGSGCNRGKSIRRHRRPGIILSEGEGTNSRLKAESGEGGSEPPLHQLGAWERCKLPERGL